MRKLVLDGLSELYSVRMGVVSLRKGVNERSDG